MRDGGGDRQKRTLGSESKHCHARARYFIWDAVRGMIVAGGFDLRLVVVLFVVEVGNGVVVGDCFLCSVGLNGPCVYVGLRTGEV